MGWKGTRVIFAMVFSVLLILPALVLAQTNLIVNGDLEVLEPNFWHKMNEGDGGSELVWSRDAYEGDRSFAVFKPSASSAPVGWVSVNNANLYWNNAADNVLYQYGFWARTEGVNTNPTTDDEKIGVYFKIYSGGVAVSEEFVVVDQSVSTKDWTKYTGAVLVPQGSKPDSVVAVIQFGKQATGKAWFDNLYIGTDPWSLGLFNGDAETPVGWLNWTHRDKIGYANLDTTYAHSGKYSAVMIERDDNDDEMVFYSEPVPVEPNRWYKISVWAKMDSVNTGPDWYATNVTKAYDKDRLGLCFFYHRAPIRTAWDLTEGDQFVYFDQRDSSSGWVYYTVISKSPPDAAGLSMRARFNTFAKGKVWYDEFSIEPVKFVVTGVEELTPEEIRNLPTDFALKQNYPNPFNPTTVIEYTLPKAAHVKLEIFDLMGRKVRTLENAMVPAGRYRLIWNARNDAGERVPSGIYFYRLQAGDYVSMKKMVLMK